MLGVEASQAEEQVLLASAVHPAQQASKQLQRILSPMHLHKQRDRELEWVPASACEARGDRYPPGRERTGYPRRARLQSAGAHPSSSLSMLVSSARWKATTSSETVAADSFFLPALCCEVASKAEACLLSG